MRSHHPSHRNYSRRRRATGHSRGVEQQLCQRVHTTRRATGTIAGPIPPVGLWTASVRNFASGGRIDLKDWDARIDGGAPHREVEPSRTNLLVREQPSRESYSWVNSPRYEGPMCAARSKPVRSVNRPHMLNHTRPESSHPGQQPTPHADRQQCASERPDDGYPCVAPIAVAFARNWKDGMR